MTTRTDGRPGYEALGRQWPGHPEQQPGRRLNQALNRRMMVVVTTTKPGALIAATPDTSSEIRGTSRIRIHEGQLERFKQLARQCIDIVRTQDTGTTEYRIYLSPDGTEAFVHERYRDSTAGIEHMTNIGVMMQPLSEVCAMTGEVCGTPDAQLREALQAAGVTIYNPLG